MVKELFTPVFIIVFHTIMYYSNNDKFTPGDYSGRDLLLTATGILSLVAFGYIISILIKHY